MRGALSLAPKRAYSTLATPISTANKHGPNKSPIVLEMPRPLSANAEAHWLIDNSDAPAHSIITANSQNVPLENSVRKRVPPSSSCNLPTGTKP